MSGRKDKERILEENKNNELFKKCLRFLFDTNITSGISKAKINKNIKVKETEQYNDSLEEILDYVEMNNTGTDTNIARVQQFINNQPEHLREFCKSVITKSLRLGIDAKSVNRVIPKFIPVFNVMLGTSIEKCKIKNGDWFSVSEKLNGCRIIFYKGDFYTRQGKKYSGLDHIRRELQCILIGTNMVVDGELIYKNPECLTNSEAFQVGTGIANSDAKEKQELKLVIFDILPMSDFENGKSNLTYKERKAELESLREAIENLALENVSIIDMFYEGTDQSEIMKWLDYAEENDMEGCMVNLDALYECKRTKSLIKVKKFYNFDLEIIGYEEGDGRLKGTLGALIVDFNGNSVSVGSGFSDEDRRFFWSNRNECIGRVIEIKYKEITRDKKTGKQSLQFPVFVSLTPTGKEVSLN